MIVRWLLVLVLLSGRAVADELPAIRIEAKDPSAAKRAVELTKALRAVATKKTGKAKPTAKDVDSAIVNAECSIVQPACAAEIGEKLAVGHVMVGQLDKRGARYTLTLSLINVRTKQRVRSLREVSAASDVRRWATALYTRIFDDGAGEIVIVANARRGQVLVDGLAVTELYEGRATLSNVALGTHGIEIRASGYKPFATEIEVDGRSEQSFLLDPVE